MQVAIVCCGVNHHIRIARTAAVNDRCGLGMQWIAHRIAHRCRNIAVFIAYVFTTHPANDFVLGRFAGSAGQAEITQRKCAGIRRCDRVAAAGQHSGTTVIRIQVTYGRVGQLICGATESYLITIGATDRPFAQSRIEEEAGVWIDGRKAIGVRDNTVGDLVFFQVARPMCLAPGAEHRQIQVVQVLRAVERINRHSRR